jgi:hypothetical protein
MILDINFRLPSYVLKRNLPSYHMIERQRYSMSALQRSRPVSSGKESGHP